MSRIVTNVQSLVAQRTLGHQGKALSTSLERLSTGIRINRGADDPAGLIASENLRAEKTAITSAIDNATRAEQVVNVAEGGLSEVSNLLIELQGLVGSAASEEGLSEEEKKANQLQIDSILQTIDRISQSTSFQGIKLLDGNFDYQTSSVDSTLMSDVNINSARMPTTAGSYLTVTVDVLTSAQTGTIFLSTGANLNGNGQSYTLELTGNNGTQQLTFASGTSQANVISAINKFKDVTGVSASQATNAARVELSSTGYGSKQFVSAKRVDGARDNIILDSAGANGSNEKRDTGVDATMLINGLKATADGLSARVSQEGFDVEIAIKGTSALNTDSAQEVFYIKGGGATFSLSPQVNLAGKVSLGIESTSTGNLGSATDGFLATLKSGGTANVLNGDIDKAQKVVNAAIKQVSSLRGRLGAFQSNTVGATVRSLGVTFENTAAAESQIRETDFASETAEMTRRQILSQSATTVLQIANSQPSNVLALLG